MFYVNDEPEGKFLYTETIKLYCIVFIWDKEHYTHNEFSKQKILVRVGFEPTRI